MKKLYSVLLLLSLIATPFYSFSQTIKGNDKIKTDVRMVSGFSKLVVQGQADLYLTQESTENVKIEADENLLELFQTSVNNGVLYVIVPTNIKKLRQITISVAYRDLKQIILMNEVELKSDRPNNFDEIDTNHDGRITNAEINAYSTYCAIYRLCVSCTPHLFG